ncbi:ankyrin repeat domain-containing protein [Spiroplasma endosymbiont of Phycita roborella]|uniref:ankyrin repeat domain-containing protein n=1 Tax=Spiroplasma endosymbiont of Phycita roborella TaxID=3066311 RepID=UPI00313CD1AD
MGNINESFKKETADNDIIKNLEEGNGTYIKNNLMHVLKHKEHRNFQNWMVTEPYWSAWIVSSDGNTAESSTVNILERIVYVANHDNKLTWELMLKNGENDANPNLIGNFYNWYRTVNEPENDRFEKSVLEAAILKNKPNLVEILVESGANINYQNPKNENKTPWELAIIEKKNKIAKYLINKIEVDKKNKNGQTPLHLAVRYKNKDIVKFLLENNANLNIKDNWDDTPLFDAQNVNNVEIFKLLVKKGADLTKKNKKGQTIKQVVKLEKKCLIMEYEKFCPDKFTLELSGKYKVVDWKLTYEKTDNESVKKIIGKIISKDEMLNIIKNYKNDFDSDEINSSNYQNQPSTSGYTSPRI